MDAVIASIIVSAIAGAATWLASRQSSKAAVTNSTTSGRVEMEKEAYERARKLDTETITRQDKELKELEEKYDKLSGRSEAIFEQNQKLHDDTARMTQDNYQLHRENTRILEQNDQILAENRRLRITGERILEDNRRLRGEIRELRQRLGIVSTDTNPMMEAVDGGE